MGAKEACIPASTVQGSSADPELSLYVVICCLVLRDSTVDTQQSQNVGKEVLSSVISSRDHGVGLQD